MMRPARHRITSSLKVHNYIYHKGSNPLLEFLLLDNFYYGSHTLSTVLVSPSPFNHRSSFVLIFIS